MKQEKKQNGAQQEQQFAYLQFTGTHSAYYTPRSFIAEAMEQGFGRIVHHPLPVGSRILFAVYKELPRIQGQPRAGRGVVFAEGVVTGWHVAPKTDSGWDMWRAFKQHLVESGKVEIVDTGGGHTIVRRACGSYAVGATYVIKHDVDIYDEFATFMKKWNNEHQDAKVSWHDFKWIISGVLTNHKNGAPLFVIEPVQFTRSYLRVVLENPTPIVIEHEGQLVEVLTYQRAEPKSTRELFKKDSELAGQMLLATM